MSLPSQAAGSSVPTGVAPHPTQQAWREALERVLADERQPTLRYQPIVDLRRGEVVGYEALARFDGLTGEAYGPTRPPSAGAPRTGHGGPAQEASPDRWFQAARLFGCAIELESRVLRSARAALGSLPRNCFLSVNVTPDALRHDAIQRELDADGDDLATLVLELTEHGDLLGYDELRPVVDRFRGAGGKVAIDDAGDGYAGLQRLLQLRPEIVKLDKSLAAGADRDEAQLALIGAMGALASRLDAWLLVEGVERPAQLEAIVRLGVPLGQGYLLGRPGPGWPAVPPDVATHIRLHSAQTAPDGVADGSDCVLGLIERVPPVREGDAAGARRLFLSDPHVDLVVVVDERDRPVGLLERSDALTARPCRRPVQTVDWSTRVADLAARSMTRARDRRFDASVLCDGRGRYVGVVRVERMVEHLATSGADTHTTQGRSADLGKEEP